MSTFLKSTSNSRFVVCRNDDRSQQAAYADRSQALGPDMLWPRTQMLGADTGTGTYGNNLSNGLEVWEWDTFMQSEGKLGQRRNTIVGVTRDSTGATLGGCTVKCFDNTRIEIAGRGSAGEGPENITDHGRGELTDISTSDANGNFTVTTPYASGTVTLVAYKAGSPNVFGASDNLTPS